MTEYLTTKEFDAVSREHSINFAALVMALEAKGLVIPYEVELFRVEATKNVDNAIRAAVEANEPRYRLGGFSEN